VYSAITLVTSKEAALQVEEEPTSEGCSGGGASMNRPVYQSALPGRKKGQVFVQTSDQPQTTEHLYPEGTLQDGGGKHDQRSTATRGLDVLFGSQGCLPYSPNCQGTVQVSLFPVEWQNFQIHVPSIWTLQCPLCFHKTPMSSDAPRVSSTWMTY